MIEALTGLRYNQNLLYKIYKNMLNRLIPNFVRYYYLLVDIDSKQSRVFCIYPSIESTGVIYQALDIFMKDNKLDTYIQLQKDSENCKIYMTYIDTFEESEENIKNLEALCTLKGILN